VRPHRTGFDVSTQGAPRLPVKRCGAPSGAREPLEGECAPVGFGHVPSYDGAVGTKPLAIPGHAIRVEPTESGRRWRTVCECGYVSATSAVESVAMGKGIHHWNLIRKSQRERQRMGIPSQTRRAV
jgi:hypothetical protein